MCGVISGSTLATRAVACGLAAFAVGSAVAAMAVAATTTGPAYSSAELVRGLMLAVGFGGLGAVVASLRPRLAAGWLMVTIGLSGGVSALAGALAHRELLAGDGGGEVLLWLSTWTWVPGYVLVPTLLLMVLPDGAPRSPRWRRLLGFVVATNVLAPLGWALTPYDEQDVPPPSYYGDVTNPVGIDGSGPYLMFLILPVAISAVIGVSSLVIRLRGAVGRERDQLLWVLGGALVTVTLLLLAWVVSPLSTVLIAVAALPLPVAIAWALLRGHLWELDIVLAPTLVYALLSIAAASIYAVLVWIGSVLLGGLLRGSEVIAFVVAAVLVLPLHTWVQRLVNRLLYGDAQDPQAAVRRLSSQIEAATHAAEILPTIVGVIASAVRLTYVELAVPGRKAVRLGPVVDSTEVIPLVHRQHDVGTLTVGLPPGGLGDRSRDLLDRLSQEAATAAYALRLQEELQLSREHIVRSREEERRRMRRDLHDDLGPGLAATAIQLERAAHLVESDPTKAKDVLDAAAGYLRSTVGAVRVIVDDLRPGVLDDLGLEAAVRDQAERLGGGGLQVEVLGIGDLTTLPAAAEVAAYRIASEALTNVARHANATSAAVRLTRNGHNLLVHVEDNGRGLTDDSRLGVGLESMHQRAAELGGTCAVSSSATGTTVEAVIPVREEDR
jgi:signal transduction histidine kinase